MNRRELLAVAAMIGAAPALRWIGISAQDATPAASPAAMTPDQLMKAYGPVKGKSAYNLAYMQVFPSNQFWQTMKEAVQARAPEDGVTVDVIALPDNGTISDQVAQMEDAVTKGYQGIILGTIDAAGIVPGIQAANDAKIPVLSVDTAPAGGAIISLVQTDNIVAAGLGANFIVKAIDASGKVLNLQGDMANQTAQARNVGLHKVLDKYPDIKVIDQSAHWNGAEGLSITENILTSDPDLKAIFAANDPPALGAIQALKAAGRSDVVVVGYDGTPAGLQAIKDGTLAADVLQFPGVMGTIGVDLMVRHLNGEEIPTHVDSGSGLATKANVDQYLK
ncbi:MAG TPA: sugar ABC transporter substrate-binding protein [Thermomicrobiales bacterium]|nr:sugar ABC transporter substrate-binding protein [Thermomicrobiales bacterium]